MVEQQFSVINVPQERLPELLFAVLDHAAAPVSNSIPNTRRVWCAHLIHINQIFSALGIAGITKLEFCIDQHQIKRGQMLGN